MNVESVYTANSFLSGGRRYVAAGSETTSEVYLYDMQSETSELVGGCPGGVMSFVPVPGHPDLFYSIMALFPGFVGQEAGVFKHRRTAAGWKTQRCMHLPFAHRCDVITVGGENYLFAVSVSKFKSEPADWSNASEIYVCKLDPNTGEPGEARLVDNTIFRNHGMLKVLKDGVETIMVSGAEGIFSIEMTECGEWHLHRIFDHEVSEFGFVDFDGDGVDEMVTIEPFHGENFVIYKMIAGQWQQIHHGELSFGHGLSCGMLNGEAIAVVGNRRDSLALRKVHLEDASNWKFVEEDIELGVGPTQTQVFEFDGKDYILSADQKKNQVVLYSE